MFDNLDEKVLNQISLIDQIQQDRTASNALIDINTCLKAVAVECRSATASSFLSETEIQQIEKGLHAAQRISTKAFEKIGV